jgi:1-acyl-sn-glycerol-3-phosphate acyltransferase
MAEQTSLIPNHTSFPARVWAWIQIITHVMAGVCTLCFVFPFISSQSKKRHIQKWSSHLLTIFDIQLQVYGGSLLPHQPYLLVANHISWLDIHAINSYRPIRFVAKAEVASWPVFGWMAKQLDTVFVRRENARHARAVVGEIAKVLQRDSICLFPEGTSSLGNTVLPFRPNLFESALVAQVPVYSLAIRYVSRVTGQKSTVPAFVGDMGLLESMVAVLKSRELGVELHFLPPISPSAEGPLDRKALALYSQESISRRL